MFCLVIVLIFSFGYCKIGSGNSFSEQRDVDEFNEIVFNVDGKLHLTQGKEFQLRIDAEEDVLPILNTVVQKNKLIKEKKKFSCVRNLNDIDFYVSFPNLEKLEVNDGRVIGDSKLILDDFEIVLEKGDIELELGAGEVYTLIKGPGNLKLTGNVTVHDIVIKGPGNFDGGGLNTKNSFILIEGDGISNVSASGILDVKIDGRGSVYYDGNPIITQDISGGGQINKQVQQYSAPRALI